MAKKSFRERDFILNEPLQKIKYGNKRKSVRVGSSAFPARAQRDKINGALLAHDFKSVPNYELSEKDIPLLKQIAAEGAISNNIPALRYHAIGHLASFQTADTFNTLSYLANYGEDFYIKSYALQALGASGIEISIPVFAQNIKDENQMVRKAAKSGLVKLIKTLGSDRVQSYFKQNPNLDSKIFTAIVRDMNQPIIKKKDKTKSGRANK